MKLIRLSAYDGVLSGFRICFWSHRGRSLFQYGSKRNINLGGKWKWRELPTLTWITFTAVTSPVHNFEALAGISIVGDAKPCQG